GRRRLGAHPGPARAAHLLHRGRLRANRGGARRVAGPSGPGPADQPRDRPGSDGAPPAPRRLRCPRQVRDVQGDGVDLRPHRSGAGMSPTCRIRSATGADAAAIARIYQHYVDHTVITFETEAPDAEAMSHRIAGVQRAGLPHLVAEDAELARLGSSDAIRGYAYASPFQERAAYRHSVEATVYLSREAAGRGVGSALYEELLERLREVAASECTPPGVRRRPPQRLARGVATRREAAAASAEAASTRPPPCASVAATAPANSSPAPVVSSTHVTGTDATKLASPASATHT